MKSPRSETARGLSIASDRFGFDPRLEVSTIVSRVSCGLFAASGLHQFERGGYLTLRGAVGSPRRGDVATLLRAIRIYRR